MIQIAVVEDEDSCAEQLSEYISRYSRESGREIQTVRFRDGDEIVEDYKPRFDIILMDIQMRFMDGVTAAEHIRKVDPEVIIMFITNMTQYAIRGYAVDALDYVLKPVDYFAFSQRFGRAISRIRHHDAHFITISSRDGTRKLNVESIAYIESRGHSLTFYTTNDSYTTTAAMKDVEEKLSGDGFCRCNKGYLVNLAYVDGIRDGCVVVGNDLLPIARARKNDFMKTLTDYLGENL